MSEGGSKAGDVTERHVLWEVAMALGSSSLKRRWPRGDLIAHDSFLRRAGGEGGAEFSLGSRDRMHMNGSKLCPSVRFRPDMNNQFFSERVDKSWNRLPTEVANAPCLRV